MVGSGGWSSMRTGLHVAGNAAPAMGTMGPLCCSTRRPPAHWIEAHARPAELTAHSLLRSTPLLASPSPSRCRPIMFHLISTKRYCTSTATITEIFNLPVTMGCRQVGLLALVARATPHSNHANPPRHSIAEQVFYR